MNNLNKDSVKIYEYCAVDFVRIILISAINILWNSDRWGCSEILTGYSELCFIDLMWT